MWCWSTRIEEASMAEPLFDGDVGRLDGETRVALTRLMTEPNLIRFDDPILWETIMLNLGEITSRLHDMFLGLRIDHENEVMWKHQIDPEGWSPRVLLRSLTYSREGTAGLLWLRSRYLAIGAAGHSHPTVTCEELDAGMREFARVGDTFLSARAESRRVAVRQLENNGLIRRLDENRYQLLPTIPALITPAVLDEITEQLTRPPTPPRGDGIPIADAADDQETS